MVFFLYNSIDIVKSSFQSLALLFLNVYYLEFNKNKKKQFVCNSYSMYTYIIDKMLDDTRRLNSFLRKTRRGHVLKITHELYLRTDITCGSNACQQCTIDQSTILDKQINNANNLVPNGHYLLIDTNIVLQQVDLLEDPLFTNVIVPQIVLDEVRKTKEGLELIKNVLIIGST